jgi:squalene-hopene/tetraprenyl-beta-curcumene cyclase
VQLKNQPTAPAEQAGVLLFVDGDNYVLLGKQMSAKQELVLLAEKTAQPAQISKPYDYEEVCLRLIVSGKTAIAQFRHYDTDEWQTLGERELPGPGPYQVGVVAGHAPQNVDHRAAFSQFRIMPKPAALPVAAASSQPAAAAPIEIKKRPIRTDVSLALQARETAERAIPYIEKDGTAWINNRKCLSCHYAGYMVWSFQVASQRGYNIDRSKLAEWSAWSLAQDKGHGAEGAAQVLLSRDLADASDVALNGIERQRDFVIGGQDKEGFWKAGGQLPSQKRPLGETNQVSTMICILALATLDGSDAKATTSRDSALAWLKKTPPNGDKPAVSAEWYTMRLLVEKKFGEPKQVEALCDQILAAQQADGGWGWLLADKSDAFGTGLALYALAEAGVANSHPAVERAWKFLIETQTDAGSWIVNGTKTANKDKPHAMSSFWGSTWALMGLSNTLPGAALKNTAAASSATSPVSAAR